MVMPMAWAVTTTNRRKTLLVEASIDEPLH